MLHKTRVAIRFRTKNTRNFVLVCLWCGRMVKQSMYGHVITNFLGWVVYHIFLPMVLRVIQLTLTLKITTARVVETSVTVNNNSPIQDYIHPDDQTQPIFEMTPGFKPFTFKM